MDANANAINWFEIPVQNLERAATFYGKIFDSPLHSMGEMGGMKMYGFPINPMSGKVGGGLIEHADRKPSTDGVTIYLNANPSIQAVIDRIEPAGGKLLMPKTHISDDIGYMAFFIDSEGNKIGIHAQQ